MINFFFYSLFVPAISITLQPPTKALPCHICEKNDQGDLSIPEQINVSVDEEWARILFNQARTEFNDHFNFDTLGKELENLIAGNYKDITPEIKFDLKLQRKKLSILRR